MARSVKYSLLLPAALCAAGVASAVETGLRRYELPNRDVLEMELPAGWFDHVEQPEGGGPPTIEIAISEGGPNQVFVTPQLFDEIVGDEKSLIAIDTPRVEDVLAQFKQFAVRSGNSIYAWTEGDGITSLRGGDVSVPGSARIADALRYVNASIHFGVYLFVGLGGIGKTDLCSGTTIPIFVFAVFQLMFAIITPALISGALADRVKFSAWVLFVVLWATIVYFPVAHWVWGDGGWAFDLGVIDFAGGTAVHINAGAAALGVIVLGAIGLTIYRNSYSRGLVLEHLPEDCAELYYIDIAGIATSDPVKPHLEKFVKNSKDLAEDEATKKSKKDKERFEKALEALKKNGVEETSIRELAEQHWNGEGDLVHAHHPVTPAFGRAAEEIAPGILTMISVASVNAIDTGDGLAMLDTGGQFDIDHVFDQVRGWRPAAPARPGSPTRPRPGWSTAIPTASMSSSWRRCRVPSWSLRRSRRCWTCRCPRPGRPRSRWPGSWPSGGCPTCRS